MLYDDIKWNRPASPADCKLDHFIRWLERQPPNERYNYMNCSGGCLLDLYFGRKTTDEEYRQFPQTFRVDIAPTMPWTFGAALERARQAFQADSTGA